MHPNLYLRTFWRSTFRPNIFVAMSFADPFKRRFTEVIEPAVQAVTYHGTKLTASRVDLSKTGDSILTDITDGIAHSVMVLADVSVIGNDAKTSEAYRNGNVMYEVGLALASRCITHDGYAMFKWTDLGRTLADKIDQLVPTISFVPAPTGSTEKPLENESSE